MGGIEEVAKALNVSPERMRLATMGAPQAARAKDISAREFADKIMVASLIVLAAISDSPVASGSLARLDGVDRLEVGRG